MRSLPFAVKGKALIQRDIRSAADYRHRIMPGANASLLLTALLGIVVLVVLIARFQMPAFVALLVASVLVGTAAGLPLREVPMAFSEGLGAVLGSIAAIIGLGSILGKLLAESGGAELIARRMSSALGARRLPLALGLVGFIIGLPTWFSVGLVLLIPVLESISREARLPLAHLGIPMVIGLAVAHGLVPPHPGPMVAIGMLKADPGRTILYSLIVGLPTVALVGVWLGYRLAVRVVPRESEGSTGHWPVTPVSQSHTRRTPGLVATLFAMLLPIALMLGASAAGLLLPVEHPTARFTRFLGDPTVAMLIGVLVAFGVFGRAAGFTRADILRFSEQSLGPVAGVLLVVGAGGGFSRVLLKSGVGDAVASLLGSASISPLLLGWAIAAVLRLAVGSATVAITTAAGLMTPLLASETGCNRELLVLAMGAGSSICSHVNDGGFWFVKEYLGLTMTNTLKTWTVLTGAISIVALVFILVLEKLLRSAA